MTDWDDKDETEKRIDAAWSLVFLVVLAPVFAGVFLVCLGWTVGAVEYLFAEIQDFDPAARAAGWGK